VVRALGLIQKYLIKQSCRRSALTFIARISEGVILSHAPEKTQGDAQIRLTGD